MTFNTPAAMSLTYSGNISGAGGLTKAGAGMLKVASLQTYNGPTIISGGTVQLTPPVGVNMQWIASGTGAITSGVAGAVPLANWNNNAFTFGGSTTYENNGTIFVNDSNNNPTSGMYVQFSGGGPYSVPALAPLTIPSSCSAAASSTATSTYRIFPIPRTMSTFTSAGTAVTVPAT